MTSLNPLTFYHIAGLFHSLNVCSYEMSTPYQALPADLRRAFDAIDDGNDPRISAIIASVRRYRDSGNRVQFQLELRRIAS